MKNKLFNYPNRELDYRTPYGKGEVFIAKDGSYHEDPKDVNTVNGQYRERVFKIIEN